MAMADAGGARKRRDGRRQGVLGTSKPRGNRRGCKCGELALGAAHVYSDGAVDDRGQAGMECDGSVTQ